MMTESGRIRLAPGYSIAPVINGCWQLTPDHGGGPASEAEALSIFAELVEQGFTTFDCADIYTGVESLIGRFRRSLPDPDIIQVHTKLVPDKATLHELTAGDVDAVINRSLQRLGMERLDLVQFHWWDSTVPGLELMAERLLEAQQAGKIRLLGVTNFNTDHTRQMVEQGIPLVTAQVQYSLLDRRPEKQMTRLCNERGLRLLPYGVLAGGFLGERYLGAPPPGRMNRSLTKYRLIIEEAGGWELCQSLLRVLSSIARKHDVPLELVAAKWVLDQPEVSAIILGVGTKSRALTNRALADLELDDDDRQKIRLQLSHQRIPAGDLYDLERDESGPHAGIIKTDLQHTQV
ncbi:MAG: aldo/keto reductase [Xanthomonadales bacterium]|nr:aldo/keto reductase [Xanthomonadales bacterium]